ncbi:MAG: PH domain-containing protein, partial [Muribaculaceae bacterium]|nr:PH domain-containing protein [Muribaculaceae bacterium]
VYVKADSRYLVLGSVLRGKKIPMCKVVSVELFQPTMAAMRICASGGFMGYWGIFRESDIGRYYGFYGKASDCFLVRMQNGDKYVVGCERPQEMVDYIRSQISA